MHWGGCGSKGHMTVNPRTVFDHQKHDYFRIVCGFRGYISQCLHPDLLDYPLKSGVFTATVVPLQEVIIVIRLYFFR